MPKTRVRMLCQVTERADGAMPEGPTEVAGVAVLAFVMTTPIDHSSAGPGPDGGVPFECISQCVGEPVDLIGCLITAIAWAKRTLGDEALDKAIAMGRSGKGESTDIINRSWRRMR